MSGSIDALASVGVAVHEIRDGVEVIRPVSDILDDLATKWNDLSAAEQQHIGLQIAGRFQLSRFLVLMQQYDTAINATTTALNSQGSGYRENEEYLKSLEARINRLKNSWTNLTLAMGDAVLTDTLIGITNALTRLAKSAKWATDNIGLLPTVLGAATTTFVFFSAKSKAAILSLMTVLGAKGTMLQSLTLSTYMWSRAMGASATSARFLSVTVGLLGIALRNLLIATGVGVAIAGLGFILEKIISHFSNASQKAKEFKESVDRTNESWISQRSNVEQLIKRHEELNEIQNKTTEQEQEHLQVQQQLAQLMPQLIAFTDSNGISHIFVGDQLERQLGLIKEIAEIERKRRIDNAKDSFDDELKNIEKLKNELAELHTKLVVGGTVTQYGHVPFSENQKTDLEIQIKRLEVEIENAKDRLPQKVSELIKDINAASGVNIKNNNIQNLVKSIMSSFKDFDKIDGAGLENLSNEFANLIRVAESLSKSGSDRFMLSYFNEIADSLKEKFPEATQTIDELVDALLKLNATSIIDESLIQTFNLFDQSGEHVDVFRGTLIDLKKEFGDLVAKYDETTGELEGFIISTEEATEKTKDLADAIKEPISELKSLNQIIDQVNKGESLNAETVADLIIKYPELAAGIQKTNEGWTVSRETLETLRSIKLQEARDAVQAEIDKTRSTLNSTSDRLKAYELEIDAINNLADAHREISKLGVSQVFGEDAFKDMSFDDVAKTITVGGVTTSWAEDTDQYRRIKENLLEQKNAYETMLRIGNLQESRKKLEELLSSGGFGVSASKSSSSSTRDQLDDTQALINAINRQANAQSELNKLSSERIKTLEHEKQYQKAVEETANLIASQKKEIELLTNANIALENERQKLQKSSGRDMTNWLDDQGNQTQAYIKLYNSLSSTGQKVLKEQFDKWKLFTQAIRDNTQSIKDLNKELPRTAEYLDDLKLKYTTTYLENQAKKLEEIEYNLSVAEKTQAMYLEGTKEYNDQQIIQNKIIQDKIKFLRDEVEWTQRRLSQGDLTKNQIGTLNEYLKKNTLALLEAQKAAKSLANTLVDDIVSAYKKMLEQQRDLELDSIDRLKEAEDDRHKRRMKHLDDEQSKFEKNIRAQIDALNRANSEEDYQRELQKLMDERSTVQAQYNTLLKDDSFEAKARRKQLQERLDEIDEQIAEKQRNRGRELTRQALEDQLEDRKEYIDKQKEIENDLHDSIAKQYDEEKKRIKTHYDSILQDEKRFYQLKQDLMSEDTALVESTLQTLRGEYDLFFDHLRSQAQVLGEMFATLNSNFKLDYDKLKNTPLDPKNKDQGGLGGGFTQEELSVIAKMKKNSQLYAEMKRINDKDGMQHYYGENQWLGKSIGATFNPTEGIWYKNGVRLYHKGGEVGTPGTTTRKWFNSLLKSNEVPAILEQGEAVIDRPVSFINDMVARVASGIGNIASRMSPPNSVGATTIGELNMTFTGSLPKDGRDFANEIVQGLRDKGIRIGGG